MKKFLSRSIFLILLVMLSICSCSPKEIVGPKGEDGVSINEITLTGSKENIDTYTIYYSNGTTSNFIISNGKNGEQGIQGIKGQDGHSPKITIVDDCWVIDDKKTNIKAIGTNGKNGENGLSAYEIYIKYHPTYKYNEEKWLDDLVNGRLANDEFYYDYSNCNLKEIKTNYLTDYLYPDGLDVTKINNQTAVKTKLYEFNKEKLTASQLFIALADSVAGSSLPIVSFYDENKKLISKTSGEDYKLGNNIYINGVYGVLRDIPDNTNYIEYQYNYLTRAWLKIYYLQGEPILKAKENNAFTNKKTVFFGDSIIGNFEDANFAGSSIPNTLSNLLGSEVINLGFGGSHMGERTDAWNAYSMVNLVDAIISKDFSLIEEAYTNGVYPVFAKERIDKLKTIDFNNIDYCLIALGTNDYTSGRKLGTLDRTNIGNYNKLDKKSYLGATQYVIEKLQRFYPSLNIIVCSIARKFNPTKVNTLNLKSDLPSNGNEKDIYFVKEEFKAYIYDSVNNAYKDYNPIETLLFNDVEQFGHNGNSNEHISTYNDGLKEVCNLYGVKYIDNYNIGINQNNAHLYYKHPDGTHPNQVGRNKIAYNIYKNLITSY